MLLNNVSSLTHLDKCGYKRPINVVFVYKNRIFARPTALLRKSFLSFSFFLFLVMCYLAGVCCCNI